MNNIFDNKFTLSYYFSSISCSSSSCYVIHITSRRKFSTSVGLTPQYLKADSPPSRHLFDSYVILLPASGLPHESTLNFVFFVLLSIIPSISYLSESSLNSHSLMRHRLVFLTQILR